jgi:hypothetical protein
MFLFVFYIVPEKNLHLIKNVYYAHTNIVNTREKIVCSKMVLEQLGIHMQKKNLYIDLMSFTK